MEPAAVTSLEITREEWDAGVAAAVEAFEAFDRAKASRQEPDGA